MHILSTTSEAAGARIKGGPNCNHINIDLHDCSFLVYKYKFYFFFVQIIHPEETTLLGLFGQLRATRPSPSLSQSVRWYIDSTVEYVCVCVSILYLYDGSILLFLQLTEREEDNTLVARETYLWRGPARAVAHSGGMYSFFFFFFFFFFFQAIQVSAAAGSCKQ